MQVQKQLLRNELGERRRALVAEEYGWRSDRIVERMKRLPEIARARTVHAFWPMTERREADIRPLLAWLYTHEKQIVLPVVVPGGEAADERRLEHRYFTGEDAMVRNRWGIHEPAVASAADLASIDVVLVPALAVGRNGHRVGYGRGHYDQFLRYIDVPTICPIFDFCVLPTVPSEEHDVALSIVVTESETLRIAES